MEIRENPSDTGGQLIAASKVNGTSVYNRSGDKLGSIYDVMLDKVSGKSQYAVLSFGGFLGIGEKFYPLPWNTLTYDPAQGGYVVDLDKSVLEGAPAYDSQDSSEWNDTGWGKRVDDYYGSPTHDDLGARRPGEPLTGSVPLI